MIDRLWHGCCGNDDTRKEVDEIKNAKSSLVAALLGSIVPIGHVLAADYVISKEEVAPGSYYCHMKLPAVQARSLPTDNPVPKDASSGDIIDYYGPCDENAVEQNRVERQRLDFNHNWILNYSD